MSGFTKVWVRRPNSSPTRIQIPSSVSSPLFSPSLGVVSTEARDLVRPVEVEISEDFLVDDLREVILKKYPQSLGKHHDAVDLSIRIPAPRDQRDGDRENYEPAGGRILAPDESVVKILMEEYPDGQRSSEAWTVITYGGRDNYTRWWLQTGGLSTDVAVRGGYSPNYFVPSTGGSEALQYQQEYFPIVPQTVVTPPGEFPRSRNSGSSMMSSGQYPRSSARPPLRQTRGITQEVLFPHRRYDSTNTSSMVVEAASGPDSEHGRSSPEATAFPSLRYPNPAVRPGSGISGRATPPGEYSGRLRQYTQVKQNLGPTSAPSQSFQMQLPQQPLPTIPQKAASPLGGPPQQRLSTGSVSRPVLPNMTSTTPIVPVEKPPVPPTKNTTSPKSPSGTSSSNSGGPISPVARRKSNTISGGPPPKPRTPSPVAERPESPRATRALHLVKSKQEKDAVPKNSSIGVIPPINVLIVEDNIINAQILEVFFRKRKLKYATAVNGKEAVEKWRQGGWHLVLMDIQLPVMSGIEATKEIRRLERVNHIGVFSEETSDKPSPEDELGDLPFPSPVIIVALTASSRESDRNEALAAGCNDFLTKPVGAPWLERKAIEWGCMQALIWTSFERKRRRSEAIKQAGENGSALAEEKGGLGSNEKMQDSPEKPPVERGDSGDSVQTQTSIGSDEGQAN